MSNTIHSSRKELYIFIALIIIIIFLHSIRTFGQNVGIGTTTPKARLHITDSNVVFSATGSGPGSPANVPISGAGRRMLWYADKAAFRSGYVGGVNWDKDSIGYASFAMGNNTKAKGIYSAAWGESTNATGDIASTAFGYLTTASGRYSTAWGENTRALGFGSTVSGYNSIASGLYSFSANSYTNASGNSSVAFGNGSIASGDVSAAFGVATLAKASNSITFGTYNDNTDSPDPFFTNATDRILQIGNGSTFERSNALTILRNGNVGIGNLNPIAPLSFMSGMGEKITFYGGNEPNYGIGVQSYRLQIHTDLPESDIVFGYGSSESFSENMRIKGNGNVGIGIDDPVYKLDLAGRMRIRSEGVFNTAGLYLNNNSNSQSPAFIGMEDDTHVGFYGSGSAWKLTMNTNTGALKINGSEGQNGQVLKSGGSSAPQWTTLGSLIKTAYALGPSTETDIMNNNGWTELPLSSELIITVDVKSRLIISGNFSLYGPDCSPCANGYGKFAIIVGNFFIHNSNPDGFATVFMEANGEGAYTLANIMYDVQPGTYNIEFLAIRNATGNNYSMRAEFVSVIAVPID